jgi:hypothetical protein
MDYAEIMNMILNKNKDLPTQKKKVEEKEEPIYTDAPKSEVKSNHISSHDAYGSSN